MGYHLRMKWTAGWMAAERISDKEGSVFQPYHAFIRKICAVNRGISSGIRNEWIDPGSDIPG